MVVPRIGQQPFASLFRRSSALCFAIKSFFFGNTDFCRFRLRFEKDL